MLHNSITHGLRRLAAMFTVALVVIAASAQPALPDSVRVSLVTYYPGSQVYELFGHTEVHVVDATSDILYNYGVFDFNSPGFVYRFVSGQTDYICEAVPTQVATFGLGRKCVEQQLNLTQEQAREVRDFLRRNARPENATYRYKYLTDNCATRPRDIIEHALGSELKYHPSPSLEPVTYRQLLAHYTRNYAWESFGIDLVLGAQVDRSISYRERMFVPMLLMNALDSATVTRGGAVMPAVTSKRTVIDGSDDGLALPPTPWYLTPMCVALLLLAVVAIACVASWKRGRVSRWLDTVFYLPYVLGGCLVFFLVFVSTHEATSPNLNALWLHPFYLVPAILVWIRKCGKALACIHGIIAVELLAFLIATIFTTQRFNAACYPLIAALIMRSATYMAIYAKQHKATHAQAQ